MLTAGSFELVEAQLKANGKLGPGTTFYVSNSTRPYVGGTTGLDDTSRGLSPLYPLATIDYAFGLCVNGRGDNIVVGQGHAEDIIAAGTTTFDKTGVTVLGRGTGTLRPTLTWTTATAGTLLVSAANCTLENFILTGNYASIVTMVSVTASDFHLLNCEVNLSTASTNALLGVTGSAAADGFWAKKCLFTSAGTGSAITLGACDNSVIEECRFFGTWAQTAGIIINSAAAANFKVLGCLFGNTTGTNTKAIVCDTSTTGIVDGNRYQILNGTAPVTGAAMAWGLNYYNSTIATAMTAI